MFRIVLSFGLLSLFSFMAVSQPSQSQIEENLNVRTSVEENAASISTTAVVNSLKNEPDWLFPFTECPVKVISRVESRVYHLAENCTTNPEKCLEDCRNNNGSACYGLALLLQEQEVETKYYQALFLRSCKLGITSGCTNRAAGMLHLEENSDSDFECIAETFAKTCDREDPWGCTMRGLVLFQGIGCDRNIEAALEILPKACEKNLDDPACQYAQSLREAILQAE